jgi:hypothetical protein
VCPICESLGERITLRHPDEYRGLARKLIEVVNQGILRLVKASCPLEELLGGTFPGDSLHHDFRCAMCGHRFALHADTYHGRVEWEPQIDGDTKTPIVQ